MRQPINLQFRVRARHALAAVVVTAAWAAAPLAVASEPALPGDPQPGLGIEQFFEDGLLTARVKLALLDAPDVSALEISVQTHQGIVQLSGFVDEERLVQRASEIASRVPGVVRVRSALQVKSSPQRQSG